MTLSLGNGVSILTWRNLGLAEELIGIACLADEDKVYIRSSDATACQIMYAEQTLTSSCHAFCSDHLRVAVLSSIYSKPVLEVSN